ncbi:hypothetical protein [Dyadobacter sp. CY323]|uniref:hypothetical protein n=1 Tax=Dyadobacter sp. CY323 TaxID=2907302 RepID=UPI001F27D7F4|nr:hypothetical protein [Dyadobacter sp. CY323]MCE6990507.1 hypothetical protein [Dyadobacter sp. CY323]
MPENNEKMEVGWMDTDDLKKYHKRGRAVSSGIPATLFLIFSLLLFGMLGLVAILPVGIAAFLFLKFSKQATRLPKWLYAAAFVILGIMIWSFFANGPVVSNRIANWIYRYSRFDEMRGEPTVIVSDDELLPTQSQASFPAADTLASQPDQASTVIPDPNASATVAAEPTAPAIKPETELPAAPDQQVFDTYINNGLKAVEDEDYSVANQNFKNAFKANPRHPRLQQLAAEFRKSADEKCQDFKNANAKELSHIPNNYYQYAASLTQTVPLKCD